MSLADRLIKNSSKKITTTLSKSTFFDKKSLVQTSVPMINVALSGSLDGGLYPGLLTLAGPSKHFKSGFCLLLASEFMRKHPEAVMLFYDSEFGTPKKYFSSYDIDLDRVIHTPVTNIEELKHDLMVQLEGIERGDKVIIVVDSIGNLASKKEVDDAIDGKSVADMTRAKALKSLGRMVTPILTIKDLPMVVVNHTYKTMEMFSKDVVSGGTGLYLSSDAIWILGRQQDKDAKTKEIDGYNFIINIEKSRHVKEKSKIPISITYEGGIMRYSGLLDVAVAGGYIGKPKKGVYQRIVDGEFFGPEFSEKDAISDKKLWNTIFTETDFPDYVKNKYSLGEGRLLSDDADSEEDLIE